MIHGSGHGAWCWRDLLAALAARGIDARAIDLPSHGEDRMDYTEVTQERYRDAILHDIARHGNRPVLLIGHSAGGFSIAAAAEHAPEKIAGLVYLCAYVPRDGMSLADMRKTAEAHPVLDLIERTDDGRAFLFKAKEGVEALCHDCPDDVADYVRTHLGPQAIRPQETPLHVTEASQTLPRHYVICDADRVIPPEEQRKMSAEFPAGHVHALPSGHAPYFAMPDRVADIIEGALRELS
ncbi:alpha/beta fold hydrolase [Celeribacter neptunius]|uniref:Pimeloyl-ACP methyl ester carboxylesterase n=1 Tax=Celeribacter neptunius TaxID=588602 RepID=A0A1I3VEE3_9RHOB|nr:alpha/beta fold hydrolase [Celeribacter neptunius]SFJ93369.1 Pimeloyl-ACP methyl ester carboxylesterase [Celeribacter neptunius]